MKPRNKTAKASAPQTVDDYIAAAPAAARAKLVELRQIIRAAAPQAAEYISYGMPFYKHHDARVSFAAFKSHIGLFGVSSVIEDYRRELAGYDQTDKGTIHFPYDAPLPAALIEQLVRARMEKAAAPTS